MRFLSDDDGLLCAYLFWVCVDIVRSFKESGEPQGDFLYPSYALGQENPSCYGFTSTQLSKMYSRLLAEMDDPWHCTIGSYDIFSSPKDGINQAFIFDLILQF